MAARPSGSVAVRDVRKWDATAVILGQTVDRVQVSIVLENVGGNCAKMASR